MQKTKIALFPLEMLLLPGELAELHIFEDRYKQLLADCEIPGQAFGIPFANKGYLSGYGSIVEIVGVTHRYDNGTADIEIRCTGMFKLNNFYLRMGDKLYPGGEIEPLNSAQHPEISEDLLRELIEFVKEVMPEQFELLLDSSFGLNEAALMLDLTQSEKLKIITRADHQKREQIIRNKMKLLSALHHQQKSVQNNVFLN